MTSYKVPNERAPQGNAFNVIQLHPNFKKGQFSTYVAVKLNGLSHKAGADWRARLIVQPKMGQQQNIRHYLKVVKPDRSRLM
nr:hypothetical protein [Lentilactobacillus otakiensis]